MEEDTVKLTWVNEIVGESGSGEGSGCLMALAAVSAIGLLVYVLSAVLP